MDFGDQEIKRDVAGLNLAGKLVQNETLEVSRGIVKLCEETVDVGKATLDTLSHQTEQLTRIGRGAEKVNEDLRNAEKNLKGLEKCCGLCWLHCRKKKYDELSPTFKVVRHQPILGRQPNTNLSRGDPWMTETDDNLNQVQSLVGTLKNMALDAGAELDQHNAAIDQINCCVETAGKRVKEISRRTENLI